MDVLRFFNIIFIIIAYGPSFQLHIKRAGQAAIARQWLASPTLMELNLVNLTLRVQQIHRVQ